MPGSPCRQLTGNRTTAMPLPTMASF